MEKIKKIIEGFYSVQYQAYLDMDYRDLTDYLYMYNEQNINKVNMLNMLVAQRRYIDKNNYGYVEKEQFPLDFDYRDIILKGNYGEVTLFINTDTNKAYPPFIHSGLNTFKIIKYKGRWKIVEHNYQGENMFEISKIRLMPRMKVSQLLFIVDFQYTRDLIVYNKTDGIQSINGTKYLYNSDRAVNYANKYVIDRNEKFYTASGNGGDCTNFISQVIWYGFGGKDSSESINAKYMMVPGNTYVEGWHANAWGGSRNWESVNHFWTYMTRNKGLNELGPRVNIVPNINYLYEGGIMQIDFTNDGSYNHTVVLVDKVKQKFAQQSANTYRYYSDYVGIKRFFNPQYMIN
ncbi:amidase domain-containing protein [Clostridiisalibacter paucivorans]|uniref:amidase domain-containing protein n=1 Tax=Clostridiisalibacter paucivorans TaxID=408753 RepID=UPI00068900BB|nr:amidase domain-containing protein [Clostridiisalibacter paucivorans]